MDIATWNVNSVKSRLQHLLDWLKRDKPDIVLLQEIKCVDEAFPAIEIEELGYNLAIHGQKTYNGVAILSKYPLSDITRGLPGDDSDLHARYIEAVVTVPCHPERSAAKSKDLFKIDPSATLGMTNSILRVVSVYVPNGQTADSDKFQYKQRFLERLHAHVKTLLTYDEALAIGGDYNIAPDDTDVHDPRAWEGSVLTHDIVRRHFRRLQNLGMYDAFRLCHVDKKEYSWWDYRAGAFENDAGLRIDHFLLSPQAADKMNRCMIVRDLRALEKASDHTPVVVSLGIGD